MSERDAKEAKARESHLSASRVLPTLSTGRTEVWETLPALMQSARPVIEDAVGEYSSRLDKAFAPALGADAVLPERWANIVADLGTASREIRDRCRRRVVRELNEREDMPRLPPDLPERMSVGSVLRLPTLPERLRMGRVALGTAGFALGAYLIAEVFLPTALAALCSVIGACIGVLAVATPISPRQKRLLSAAGLAALAGTTLIGIQGGLLTVFAALRVGARGIARFPFVSTLLIVFARRWVRRATFSEDAYREGREIALAEFRADLEADAQLAVVAQTILADHARKARRDEQRLHQVEEAIGSALPHADRIAGPDFVRRLANLVGIAAAPDAPEELVWSADLAPLYCTLAVVNVGDRVLVLKPPVMRKGEGVENQDIVVERGEVTRLRSSR